MYKKDGKCYIHCTFAWIFTPPVFDMQCGIYHLCHIFTLQYLHICDKFARNKFVQIHFFVSVENVAILSRPKTSLGVRLSRIHFSEGEK